MEIGTGCGVGAAWLVSGRHPDASLVTVENDRDLATAAAELFRDEANVEVVEGDWHDVLPPQAPFDLVFFDGGPWKQDVEREAPRAVELLADGGLVVVDDLGPRERWPGPDPVRDFFFGHPALAAAELLPTPDTVVLLAARRAVSSSASTITDRP